MHGFLERLDIPVVQQAIAQAELRTSGELRVSVAPFFWGSVRRAAERAFARLGMDRTRYRNGVLFFIVPSRRAFVVLGDRGIHECVGDDLWNGVVQVMSPFFKRREFTAGVLAGIDGVARALAVHFPREAEDRNELPDVVDEGVSR
jgi:uncharacterized membrane protein